MRAPKTPWIATLAFLLASSGAQAATRGEPVAPEVASPEEVPADLLSAPARLLEAVASTYFPGDHDPSTPSGALRWRVWSRHYPEVAAWAEAHHGVAEWAHHHPGRTEWALAQPGQSLFVHGHPDIVAWQRAHPRAAQRSAAQRAAHTSRPLWDEITGRTQGALSDAAVAAATAPEPTESSRAATLPPPEVTPPEPAEGETEEPRFEVRKPRFEVRKPRTIARVGTPDPPPSRGPVAAPGTVIVHETRPVHVLESAPIVLRTAPRLRYRYRPRVVYWPRYRWSRHGRYRDCRGHGRSHRRHRGRHHRHHRWW